MNTSDQEFLSLAFNEAQKAVGLTGHNPAVGAVLVLNGKVVGVGHTQAPGKNHAEVEAIKHAGEKARGATLYVTLEPCCHKRKLTPPCVDAIIEAGIARVVVALKDPNPLVSGKGIKRLKDCEIKVELPSLGSALVKKISCLNQPFFKAMKLSLPYVTLKAGITLDGKIATRAGESKWITNELARADARIERSLAGAVVVGCGTVKADDPELAPHGKFKNKKLLRVIIDPLLSLGLNYKIFRDENVVVIYSKKASSDRRQLFVKKGIEIIECGNDRISWRKLLTQLHKKSIRHVFVEGGAGVHGSLCDAAQKDSELLDQILFYIAPKLFGGVEAISAVGGVGVKKVDKALDLRDVKIEKLDSDLKYSGFLNYY